MATCLEACKKADERSCWKGHGEESNLEIPLDSVSNWVLNKGIKYRIFQDMTRKLVVKGGKNMIKQISADYKGNELTVSNNNKCHFLRNSDRFVEVEIHYPYIGKFYIEPSDSVIFEGKIISDQLIVEARDAGGSIRLDVEANFLQVVVSEGTADYLLSGHANYAQIQVQHNGFANATNFMANSFFVYQNSTADLYVNLEGASTLVKVDGTGEVYYKGEPSQLIIEGAGSGNIIQF